MFHQSLLCVLLVTSEVESQTLDVPTPTSGIFDCSVSVIDGINIPLEQLNDTDGTPGLVARAFQIGTDGNSADAPEIKVYRARTVCAASGLERNTISSISLLVDYECVSGVRCEAVGVPLNSRRTDQFQFSCTGTNYSAISTSLNGSAITLEGDVEVNFTTVADTECGICGDSPVFGSTTDTHCLGKPTNCTIYTNAKGVVASDNSRHVSLLHGLEGALAGKKFMHTQCMC